VPVAVAQVDQQVGTVVRYDGSVRVQAICFHLYCCTPSFHSFTPLSAVRVSRHRAIFISAVRWDGLVLRVSQSLNQSIKQKIF